MSLIVSSISHKWLKKLLSDQQQQRCSLSPKNQRHKTTRKGRLYWANEAELPKCSNRFYVDLYCTGGVAVQYWLLREVVLKQKNMKFHPWLFTTVIYVLISKLNWPRQEKAFNFVYPVFNRANISFQHTQVVLLSYPEQVCYHVFDCKRWRTDILSEQHFRSAPLAKANLRHECSSLR